MEMKFCPNCGTALAPEQKFCPNCGTPVAAPQPVTTSPIQQPVTTSPAQSAPNTVTPAPQPVTFVPAQQPSATGALPSQPPKKSAKKAAIIVGAVVLALVLIAGIAVLAVSIGKQKQYNTALEAISQSSYREAVEILEPLAEKDYKDSAELLNSSKYHLADEYLKDEEYKTALEVFEKIKAYKDSGEKIIECKVGIANNCIAANDFESLNKLIDGDSDYKSFVLTRISPENKIAYVKYFAAQNKLDYTTLPKFNTSAEVQLTFMENIRFSGTYYKNLKKLYTYTSAITSAKSYNAGFKKYLKKLIAMWNFKPVQALMQSDDCLVKFMAGNWQTYGNTYYYKFTYADNGSVSSVYSMDSYAGYGSYKITNRQIVFINAKTKAEKAAFKITFVNANLIKLYSYKDKITYTLARH